MKNTKRIIAVLLTLLFVLPFSLFNVSAADESWTFIDGENITRQINTAVIYRNIEESGQTRWGLNIAVDKDGVVTAIYAGGNSESENLKIPEGGAVISASGVRLGWFDENVKIGSKLYYDGYTQKLFLCKQNGDFEPFFTQNAPVEKTDDGYRLIDPTVEGTPPYTYDIAVDKDGYIIERGSNVSAPEDGFILSAATEEDRNFLIMYAPLGARCVIEDNIAQFTYSTAMLKKTAQLVFDKAKAKADNANESFLDVDFEKLTTVIDTAERRLNEDFDYKSLIEFVLQLEKDIDSVCSEPYYGELRAAFHTPDETDSYSIYTTVKKAKDMGLNTLILRVSNGYNTIVPMPEDSKFSQNPIFKGMDVIDTYLKACEQEGIDLSLCFDVYYNENATTAERNWVTAPNGTEVGLSNKYFSPGSVDFKAYYLEYVKYIVAKYEDIDNIMFDYLRYPKFHEDCDIGYDYHTMQSFSEQEEISLHDVQAIKTELFKSPLWGTWNKYRMSLVDGMARDLSETVRSARPDITMTVVSARDTVDYYYLQNSLKWIDEGVFDGVSLSFAQRDADENDLISELALEDGIIAEKSEVFKAFTAKRSFFFTVLDSGRKLSSDLLMQNISESRENGSDGFIFSDLNAFDKQCYYTSLSENVLKGEAVSPFGNIGENTKAILNNAKAKINGNLLSAGAFEEKSANAANAKINQALVLIDEGTFGKEEASTLRQDIAVIFAASEAKDSIVRDFDAIEKAVSLAKDKPQQEEEETEKEESKTDSNENEASTDAEANVDVSQAEDEKGGLMGIEMDLDFAYILIYGFVGTALIGALISAIMAMKRKGKKAPKRHLPKAAENEPKDE